MWRVFFGKGSARAPEEFKKKGDLVGTAICVDSRGVADAS